MSAPTKRDRKESTRTTETQVVESRRRDFLGTVRLTWFHSKGRFFRPLNRSSFPAVIFSVLLSVFSSELRADIVTTTDGKTYPDLHVDSVVHSGGQAIFYLRAIRNGAVVGTPYPLPAAQVSRIEFRTPWDTKERPDGRPAALDLQDGRRFEGAWVESCAREGDQVLFQVRQAGVPPGGEAHEAPLSFIRTMVFTPMNLPGAPLDEVPGLSGQDVPSGVPNAPAPTALSAHPTPVPFSPGEVGAVLPPEAGSPPAVPTPSPVPSLDSIEGEVEAPESSEGPVGVPPSASDEESEGDVGFSKSDFEYDDNEYGYGGRGGGFADMGFSIFGYFVNLLSLIIGMLVALVGGGISLYFSARTEDTADFSFLKAVATAALLAIFPPLIFIGVFYSLTRIFPWLVIMWLFVAIAAWWFAGRAIVMGMLEVLEGKASAILAWFYVYLIAGQYLAGKAIEKFF